MVRVLFAVLIGALLFSNSVLAATVECSFVSETVIRKSGEWVKTETDYEKLIDMFGDGLSLNLQDSLLEKLDSTKPFLAGVVKRGSVYLMGGSSGIEGKLINVTDSEIIIYDASCGVEFGG